MDKRNHSSLNIDFSACNPRSRFSEFTVQLAAASGISSVFHMLAWITLAIIYSTRDSGFISYLSYFGPVFIIAFGTALLLINQLFIRKRRKFIYLIALNVCLLTAIFLIIQFLIKNVSCPYYDALEISSYASFFCICVFDISVIRGIIKKKNDNINIIMFQWMIVFIAFCECVSLLLDIRCPFILEYIIISLLILSCSGIIRGNTNINAVIIIGIIAVLSLLLSGISSDAVYFSASVLKPIAKKLLYIFAAIIKLLYGKGGASVSYDTSSIDTGDSEILDIVAPSGNFELTRMIFLILFAAFAIIILAYLLKLIFSWILKISVGSDYVLDSDKKSSSNVFKRFFLIIKFLIKKMRFEIMLISKRNSAEYKIINMERKYRRSRELCRKPSETPRQFIMKISEYESKKCDDPTVSGAVINKYKNLADFIDNSFYG